MLKGKSLSEIEIEKLKKVVETFRKEKVHQSMEEGNYGYRVAKLAMSDLLMISFTEPSVCLYD